VQFLFGFSGKIRVRHPAASSTTHHGTLPHLLFSLPPPFIILFMGAAVQLKNYFISEIFLFKYIFA
jgi:hypothetical protein